jgi:CO/xanthine dehydrogenase Mo-binding subunit
MKAGKPVRWALTTKEHFLFGTTKAPHYTTFKLGVKKDGSLTAVHRTHISNAGAYGSTALLTSGKCTLIGSGPYRIPNQFSEIWIAYTNKPQSGSFRGFGISQAAVAFETMMDLAAKRLGIDPMEFRLRNALVDGDTCGTGQTMHSVGMKACYEKVRAASGWDQRKGVAQATSASL